MVVKQTEAEVEKELKGAVTEGVIVQVVGVTVKVLTETMTRRAPVPPLQAAEEEAGDRSLAGEEVH